MKKTMHILYGLVIIVLVSIGVWAFNHVSKDYKLQQEKELRESQSEISHDNYMQLSLYLNDYGKDSEYGKRLLLALSDDKVTQKEFDELKIVIENFKKKSTVEQLKRDLK